MQQLNGSARLKVAIIGLGDWGECHLQALQMISNVEVVALCDRNETRVKSLAQQYGIQRAYIDPTALYEDASIDLIHVVTYEKEHLQPVLQSLRAGKHVLVEKPVATIAEEAMQMHQVAKECNRMIFPGHVLRFDARYAGVYESIREGRLGQVVSMHLKRSRLKSMFSLYKRTHTVYMSTVHDIDIALWYADSRVSKVKAWGRQPADADVPDILWAMLQFENGMVAVLESDWLTPDGAGIDNNDLLEVIGEAGIARLDVASPGYYLLGGGQGRSGADFHIHYKVGGRYGGALTAQMAYATRCIQEGHDEGYTSFEQAIHGIEVANAIEKSILSGMEIEL